MAYTFEITRVSKLAKAHVGVLDGKLLDGSVTTGSTADWSMAVSTCLWLSKALCLILRSLLAVY